MEGSWPINRAANEKTLFSTKISHFGRRFIAFGEVFDEYALDYLRFESW